MSDGYNRLHRHVEAVRNYLGACIREIMHRQEQHDQSKFEEPELSAYLSMGHVRNLTYGSLEYEAEIAKHLPALEHHWARNPYHIEYHRERGYRGMNLIDWLEALCDWRAANLRHADGDIFKSIEYNQKRYGYSDDIKEVLINTAQWLNDQKVFHKANES